MSIASPQTFSYKQVSGTLGTISVNLDVYPPAFVEGNGTTTPAVPAVVYFHGGGLTVGNRNSWFPTWLHNRTTNAGHAFISADYQLLPPSTGHDIVKDVQDVLAFVVSKEFASTSSSTDVDLSGSSKSFGFKVDREAIAVAGSSAGGLCAYLAAMHCTSPKPKAVVSMYGMGGDFFTSHYLSVKTKPFFRGREILDPQDFVEYLHPNHVPNTPVGLDSSPPGEFVALQPIADSPLVYHPETYHIPGYPASPRMLITRLYLQLGIYIDYYTGAHENGGISLAIREALERLPNDADDDGFDDYIRAAIPERHHSLFPQLKISGEWPPIVLVHGTDDTAVPIGDSRALERRLKAHGVDVQLWEVPGREHSFDYEPGAEQLFGGIFDRVGEFLKVHIGSK